MLQFRLLAGKFRARSQQYGLIGAVSQTIRRAIQEVPIRDEYDVNHGTDTGGNISLWKFRINSPNAQHGVHYGTASERHIESLLSPLPRNATFVDLGCGKGRPLMIAAKMRFKAVLGIEFVRELAEIAESNLRKTGTIATVIRGDAAEYEFPEGPLVVYLYNPFDATVMTSVARNLERHERELWVIYINPRHCELFDAWMKRQPLTSLQEELFTPTSVAIWHRGCRLDSATS